MSDLRTPSVVKARTDHALETAADYVELIQDLVEETGEARAVDIAVRMGVSHVTVSKTLQRLSKEGFVTYRPYRSHISHRDRARIGRRHPGASPACLGTSKAAWVSLTPLLSRMPRAWNTTPARRPSTRHTRIFGCAGRKVTRGVRLLEPDAPVSGVKLLIYGGIGCLVFTLVMALGTYGVALAWAHFHGAAPISAPINK